MIYEADKMHDIIDAHIHLDIYTEQQQGFLIDYLQRPSSELHGLLAVSMNLSSCKINLELAKQFSGVYPIFGFHPEQAILSDAELQELFTFMELNKDMMVAVGEVGLPYYMRKKDSSIQRKPYEEILEAFIHQANEWNKPIVLHAVYEDADCACDLLEKYSINKAHFHWFKGSPSTIERMIQNGYYVSVTPDCVYEKEIQSLIKRYPIDQLMIETDGPWPFEGPFKNKMTHPNMMHHSIETIASIKNISLEDTYKTIYTNTQRFFTIS